MISCIDLLNGLFPLPETLAEKSEVILSNEVNGAELTQFESCVVDNGDGEKLCLINNRTYGNSLYWYTTKRGYKKQEWREDTTKQVADDYTNIKLNLCRCCKKENVKSYEKNYFFLNSAGNYVLYNFANGYCEKCAAAKAAVVVEQIREEKPLLKVVKESLVMLAGNSEPTLFQTLENGEVYAVVNELSIHKGNK